MNKSKPKAQSTPNYAIKGRRGIKNHDDSVPSPIFNPTSALPSEPVSYPIRSGTRSPSKSPQSFYSDAELSQSDSADGSEVSEYEENPVDPETGMIPECAIFRKPKECHSGVKGMYSERKMPVSCSENHAAPSQERFYGPPITKRSLSQPPTKLRDSSSQTRGLFLYIASVILVIALFGGVYYYASRNGCENCLRNQLYEALKPTKFQDLNQDQAFWRGIAVQIDEVVNLASPRSIVFLYEPKGLEKLQKILKIVANAAACRLRCCGKEPIRLNSSRINSQREFEDYGVLIETYRPDLEESGVLVMENLNQISGQVAQAFHSFCDDSSPVVEKALIVFTVEVKKLPIEAESVGVLRKVLSASWVDIGKSDKFDPLFARIAGHIELVHS